MEIKKKFAAVAFTGVLGASAAFIGPSEGIKFKAYQDVGKVWTVCRGHTGPDVIRNKWYTEAQCAALFNTDLWVAMNGVLTHVQREDIPEPVLVSYTSFAFNVGVQKFQTSTMGKLAKAGRYKESCAEFKRWKFAGGYDCSVRSNNCYGVWERRAAEENYCMSAFK